MGFLDGGNLEVVERSLDFLGHMNVTYVSLGTSEALDAVLVSFDFIQLL